MDILRTDETRFRNLPDYDFAPSYVEPEPGLRMHYVDEGPRGADPVLMLHGEPSWSYLYRRMIPVCASAGHRVIAPDLIGFGKSDKPARVADYSYARHVAWTAHLLERLDLRRITLVCQDWGSLIGLRLAAEHEARFARVVVANGMLPTGDEKVPTAFKVWKAFALHSPIFPVGRIVDFGSARSLSPAEIAAYDAPFPSTKHMAGVRAFPALVPVRPDDPASAANRAAWEVLRRSTKPFLTCFSTGDPITRGGDRYMQKRIPGAASMPHTRLRGGHFLQEDVPSELATKVNELIAAT
jgi:haloalkane dehalogenase